MGVRRVAGLWSWRRKVGDLGEMPAGAQGQGFDLGPHVVTLEALGVGGEGGRKGREGKKKRKGEGGGRMSSQPESLASFFFF